MDNGLKNLYFVKNDKDVADFKDVTELFDGVRILSCTDFCAKGKPINVYSEQWINSQEEDFMITTLDSLNNPVVIRENIDIDVTFAVRQKYASGRINVMAQHDAFVSFITDSDVWIKSNVFGGKTAHCVCLKEYKPTITKIRKNNDESFIMGTITLHTLEIPI